MKPIFRCLPFALLALPLLTLPATPALAQMIRPGTRTFDNFDLRENPSPAAAPATLTVARQRLRERALASTAAGANPAVGVANQVRRVEAARAALAARVSGLQVENGRFGTAAPEIVGSVSGFLTADAPSRPREEMARAFLADQAALYGLTGAQAAGLVKFADYANPQGGLSWVEFRQEIAGVPVFQGEIRLAFTPGGALARTVGNLAPALDDAALAPLASTPPALDPAAAAVRAAATIGQTVSADALPVRSTAGRVATLAAGPFVRPVVSETVFFVTEPGVATLAYQMTLWERDLAYLVVVDANDGTLLFRKCITEDQTQSVSYRVYTTDSPAPLSPSSALALPGQNFQAPGISPTLVSLIADDLTASPLGWITDGNNTTKGNNVTAGLDIDGTDGVDANVTGSGSRAFEFSYNPPPLNNNPDAGDAPTLAAYRNGAVTNLFFWTNRYHDRLYQLGFTEQARNFQTLNTFTINGTTVNRGGVGNDAVSAEAQDSSGTDNANFTAPTDGMPGRMQMYLFTGSTPRRDGSLDGDVFLHELTHGTSNRLHANSSGLTTLMARGMGEGWSDFYARALLATADEDVNGRYASGSYVTYKLGGSTNNYYYGIRRFPYALLANVGDASATRPGRPHNPLTFADVDPAQINLNDGAYPPNPLFANNAANEIHNAGEVWCMMLLESRARLINRLGFATGNPRALQIVTDAMKLDPVNPTVVQARDSLVVAALAANPGAVGNADAIDVRVAFALRGCGATASTDGTAVVESFVPDVALGAITVSDALGNNNGSPDAGEDLTVSVPVTNLYPTAVTPVRVSVNASPLTFGTINAGATVTKSTVFRVPANAAVGSTITFPVTITGSGGQQETRTVSLRVGSPVYSFIETFDGASTVPPALPSGWTSTVASYGAGKAGTAWTTVSSPVVDAARSAFSPDLAGSGVSGGEASLVSPFVTPGTAGTQLGFRHVYSFEAGSRDGGVLEIRIGAAGTFQDIVDAGGSFASGGYTGRLPNTNSTPLYNRVAWVNSSAGTVSTVVNLPAAAVGQQVQFRWRLGFDGTGGNTGWNVDSVGLFTGYVNVPVDTDGDGLQDGYETANGLNPDNPNDARLDSDGDGVSNLDEARAGTDPRNANSALRVTGETRDAATAAVTFTFPSVNGRVYRAERNDDLANAAGWTLLQDNIAGTGANVPVTDSGAAGQNRRFYRVRVIGP